jgi:dynein heavy chain
LSRHVAETFIRQEGIKTHVTSAAYLELVRSYACLMRVKQEEIMAAKLRYLGGLNKLMFAAEQVRHFVSAVSRMWCLLMTVMMDVGIVAS